VEPPLESIGVNQFKGEAKTWEERTGGEPTEIHILSMKTKWASCASRGWLTFDLELLLPPADLRDGVMLKELMRLKVPNHGRVLKALLSPFLSVHNTRN
jgi:predicted metal-dependent hydrolase